MKSEHGVALPAYRTLADRLRTEIVSGRLKPGERLPTEPQLCGSTGLSRSTVREALRLLASQHLITTVRGVTGGSFVTQPHPSLFAESLSNGLQFLMSCGPVDGHQVFEVRELLEVPAAGLAARRADAEDIAVMRATFCDPETADLDTLLAGSSLFHAAVARACGNPVLQMVLEPLYSVGNQREIGARFPFDRWQRFDRDHREILAAIESRDVGAARGAAAAHLAALHETYADVRYQPV
ncbi:GntR family transcriptional regulator [Virgisporangium aliadipatigenens]|uniref:GntR family transcriptional regulator n=1 Tax=Virgisporangium aliadipatigenens TaxID=741659 RepID=A0A8J4DUL1_9ACTN|nr:FCD domain-containing protein [Virgisporangium aliadipatigenens]GIJ50173.1 GntR family transcriptional regulator [Virgisporangium aliadipatigenens]